MRLKAYTFGGNVIDLHFGMTGLHVPPMRRDIVQRLSN